MKRFILFGLGSFLGACIDFSVTWLFLQQGVSASFSLAIAMCMSATLVYFYHEYLTFNQYRDAQYSNARLSKFLTTTLMIYGFRVALFYGLIGLQVADVFALGLALVLSVFVNFFISKLLIFKR